jgi:hypothetical protein
MQHDVIREPLREVSGARGGTAARHAPPDPI